MMQQTTIKLKFMQMIKSSSTNFIAFFCLFCTTIGFSQETIIDGVIAVVGLNPILKSELDAQYRQMLSNQEEVNENSKCEIVEELLYQKLLLAQAQHDSVTVGEDQIEQELTVDFLHRFEEEIKGSGLRVLLILDDVVNDIRKNKGVDKVLAKILYNRRHITADGGDEANGVTVWLTTQSWNRIPLMIRKVANGLIAFKLKNMKEILSIYDEFVIGLSKEQFLAILKYVYKAACGCEKIIES